MYVPTNAPRPAPQKRLLISMMVCTWTRQILAAKVHYGPASDWQEVRRVFKDDFEAMQLAPEHLVEFDQTTLDVCV